MVTLAVDDELDPDADKLAASLLLGRDFLQGVWLTFIGGTMAMVSWPSRLEP